MRTAIKIKIEDPPPLFVFYVYILKSSKDNKCYIGLTSDLRRRIAEHNRGQIKSIKYRKPLAIVYYEAYLDLQDAKIRELKLKKYKNSYIELKKRIFHSLSKA